MKLALLFKKIYFSSLNPGKPPTFGMYASMYKAAHYLLSQELQAAAESCGRPTARDHIQSIHPSYKITRNFDILHP